MNEVKQILESLQIDEIKNIGLFLQGNSEVLKFDTNYNEFIIRDNYLQINDSQGAVGYYPYSKINGIVKVEK